MSGRSPDIKERLGSGLALQEAGRLREAAEIYSAILQEEPREADAWHLLATIEIQRDQFEPALLLIEKAMALVPGRAIYHHNRAFIHGALGRMAEAEADYREALRLKPDYAEAYFNLSGVTRFEEGDPAFAAVEGLLQAKGQGGLSSRDRCFLHFAAGKMYDDVRDVDRAFAHYRDGNAAKGVDYDLDANRAHFARIAEVFDEAFFEAREGQGAASALPVFVVGMPRSGTTLVEQIIASHPKAHGAGELPDLPSISKALPEFTQPKGTPYPDCMAGLPAKALKGLGEAYLKRLREVAPAAERVVDKAPLNGQHLGLVAALLPAARIIHCRRDALDTCLSCYFQNFSSGQHYSFDLSTLGHFYRDYANLMAHWYRVLPTPIHAVDYEALVADPETEIPALIAACGLEWDDACLAPHRTARPIGTASRWQVRQPVYRSSVRRWQRFAEHLTPLREALGPHAGREADED